MDYEYEYTKILRDGNWEEIACPVLYESPRNDPDKMIYTRRAIFVKPASKDADERSIGREIEASDSHDLMHLIIRGPNQTAFLQIVDKMRKIHVDQTSTRYTEVRFLGDIKETPGKGIYAGTVQVICYRTGKFIGEYT